MSLEILVITFENDAARTYGVRSSVSRQNRCREDPVEREREAEDTNRQRSYWHQASCYNNNIPRNTSLRLSQFLFLQNGRMLIHWAALGGHDDLVRHLLSLDVPVDPVDDVRDHCIRKYFDP